MARLLSIFISDEMEADSDRASVDLDYSGIPEYFELERKLTALKASLGDSAMKGIPQSI